MLAEKREEKEGHSHLQNVLPFTQIQAIKLQLQEPVTLSKTSNI